MLETERVLIRPWTQNDLGLYAQMASDIGYNYFSLPGRFLVRSEEEARKKVQARINRFARHRIGKFPMFRKDTGAFIGTVGYDAFEFEGAREFELGTRLLLAHWDHGFGREAMVRLVRYAFEDLDLKRVFCLLIRQNKRAVRCKDQFNFKFAGKIQKDQYEYEVYGMDRP